MSKPFAVAVWAPDLFVRVLAVKVVAFVDVAVSHEDPVPYGRDVVEPRHQFFKG